MAQTLSEYDWDNWQAQQVATLLLIVRDGQVLLIRKKRGLGAGKINGPGGKIDPGETALQCAEREVQEEIGVTPRGTRAMGELLFQFVSDLTIRVYVFRADDLSGTLRETDEALPMWFDFDKVPYAEMWPDDEIWLPWLIAGHRYEGRVLIGENDTMLDHDLHVVADDHVWNW